MKKLQIVMLALVAMFAFSAMLATVASAETTLLSEWLVNGNPVTALTSATITGELLLKDTKEKIMVLCSGILNGSIGLNGEDEITEVLNLEGLVVSLAEPLLCAVQETCETSPTANVVPLNLPWHSLLYLSTSSGLFLDAVFSAGYDVECDVLGISVSEECKTPTIAEGGSAGQLVNGTSGVEGSLEPASPLGNCSVGGTKTGEVEPEDGAITKVLEDTLTISE